MKKFSLKLACILIIVCFSLLPLSAADFNQTDSNVAETNIQDAVDPNLKIHIEPYSDGHLYVYIHADKDFKGYVELTITTWDGQPYKHYYSYVSDGSGYLPITGFEKGNYVLQANYDGEPYYGSKVNYKPWSSRIMFMI